MQRGRNPGVKGWLRENIPALALQYTTVMRYKAAAKKLKQITELSDPTPMDVVLPPQAALERMEVIRDYGADEIMAGAKVALGEAKNGRLSGGIVKVSPSHAVKVAESQDSEVHLSSNEVIAPHVAEVPSVEVVRARAIWEEVVKDVGKSATALFERLDALVDPARVEDANMLAAWREKYANEITERTKKMWWLRRLWRKVG